MSVDPLSRRERQLMDVLYRLEEGTVAAVREGMDDPPSYSTVRAQLGTLTKKGHLVVRQEGARYLYAPAVPAEQASRSALKRIVDAFFGGKPAAAAMALLEMESMDQAELDRLKALVEQGGEA